jgi:hypothetical protein
MTHELYIRRMMSLSTASKRAKNPEWKKLWKDMMKQLIENNRAEFEEELN